MKRYELHTVSQDDRVASLREHVIIWMDSLREGEILIVGLPQVLGSWEECAPLVVFQGMQEQFLSWLNENQKWVRGPYYNLPKLNAFYMCVVAEGGYDPRLDDLTGYPKELQGTLVSFGNFLTESEKKDQA